MLLNTIEAGIGDDVALLLHGMMGSAESWHRVIPLTAEHGYRVLALDLPGHGLSERDQNLTVDRAAAAVVDTVTARGPARSITALGHSFGGIVLAEAARRLPNVRPVYIDAPFTIDATNNAEAIRAQLEHDRGRRTREQLAGRPGYGEHEAVFEARAAERFDAKTAASVSARAWSWQPAAGSIIVRADPSNFVSSEDARQLASDGVDVRSIAGAAHTVWYSHFDEFVRVLPEVFGAR